MVTRKSPPRERLSPAVIVDSALRVADREGLEAVTIRRLAHDHGVTPMALYSHFEDKESLLAAMVERMLGEVVLPPGPSGPWDSRIAAILYALLAVARAHPTAVTLLQSRTLDSETGLAIANEALGALREGGFTAEQSAQLATYLLSAITALVQSEPGRLPTLSGEAREAVVRSNRARLMSVSPEKYPNVVDAADYLADCRSADAYYERGVAVLVQGVATLRFSSAGAR